METLSNLALGLAREVGQPPRTIAERLAAGFPRDASIFESVEVAGPGFLNFRYSAAFVAAQSGNLDLSAAAGTFTQRWFNPRDGLFAGTPLQVAGGSSLPLGTPPEGGLGKDWVVLLTR